MNGLDLVRDRREQQLQKGYDAAHDDTHEDGVLALAAGALLSEGQKNAKFKYSVRPGDIIWIDRLIEKHGGDRIDALAHAGALIVAEIERLQRLKDR